MRKTEEKYSYTGKLWIFSTYIVSGATENQQIHDTSGSKAVCVRQAARDRQQNPEPETGMGGGQVMSRSGSLLGASMSMTRISSESGPNRQIASPTGSSK